MADQIRETPRSPILGLFSDLVNVPLQYMSDPQRTQQMQGMASFIRGTGVPSTLESLSYGQSLFTGAGGLGGTTRLRPDAMEALLTVAPMAGPAAKLAGRAVMATRGLPVGASIKNVGKIDELTGLPLNPDGTVTLFHHTNKNAAEQIAKTGRLKSAGEPSVYLTTQKTPDTGYGDVVVPVRVRPSMLNLDDEFPGGRMDFSIDVGKPKGSIPIVVEKPFSQYPQEEALRLAQQRAALPVSEGGLGLPAGNTPMDRARAMGFDTEAYHATQADVDKFRKNKVTPYGDRFFFSPDPEYASQYSDVNAKIAGNTDKVKAWKAKNAGEANPNLIPVLLKSGEFKDYTHISPEYVVNDPSKIRSRFAAFDPTRRNEPDLLAGALPFTALLDEENRRAIDEILNNPIMYRDPFGSTVR